jgi:uncharacterized protein
MTIDQLMQRFDLKPLLVEGGYFVQSYRSSDMLPRASLPQRFMSDRPAGTAIMYLYTPDEDCFSAVHKLPTDEIYHFYMGDPVLMLQLYPDGTSKHVILGQDILNGQQVQYVAPRDVWMASYLLPGGTYALAGTTMAPGFVASDYEGGEREALIAQYPHEAELIRRLTRPEAPLAMPPRAEA